MEKPFTTLKREEIYDGKIIHVVRDTITLPDGKTTKREVALHKKAAAIVPVDSDGKIVLVKQYRHPVGEEVYEIPAGIVEEGEEPLDCAMRELEEETAYKCNDLKFLCKMGSAVGFSNEMIYIYIAENLSKGVLNLDEHEFIDVYKFSIDEITEMIKDGTIYDSKTLVGILGYIQKLK